MDPINGVLRGFHDIGDPYPNFSDGQKFQIILISDLFPDYAVLHEPCQEEGQS